MANGSFAGLSGGVIAGGAVAVAVAVGGFLVYDNLISEPPTGGEVVQAVLQPKPEPTPKPVAVAPPELELTPEVTEAPNSAIETAPVAAPDVQTEPGPDDVTPDAASVVVEAPVSNQPAPVVIEQPIEEEAGSDNDVAAEVESKEVETTEAAPLVNTPTEPVATTELAPPRFDVVRVDADGNALVAGAAAPNSLISILLDRAEILTTAADRQGKFVALFEVAPSDAPRSISLVMEAGNIRLASAETVVIEPVIQTVEPSQVIADADVPPKQSEIETEDTASLSVADDVREQVPETEPVTAKVEVDEVNSSAEELIVKTDPDSVLETVKPTDTPEIAALSEETEPDTHEPVVAQDKAKERPAPRILLADENGVRVLSDPTPRQDISIDTISYTSSGNAVVAGRGQGDAVVRIYLNGSATADATVTSDGSWSSELLDVNPGVYTLRADQLDPEGNVTSRVQIPFKRESIEVLAAVQPQPTPEPDLQEDNAEVTATEPLAEGSTGAELNAATAAASVLNVVTVQPGFTLWGIAAERYGDGVLYVKVFDANADQIRDPDLIYPGQVFTVPE
ncbi:MAG: LysM peptidoglycan-binding domain-containing protein [Pseudoruegeria sp.]